MTITAAKLESLKACPTQIATFRELFGDGPAPMSVETAVAHADEFDWDWAAAHMLSTKLWLEYRRVTPATWQDYKRVTARAFAEAYIKQEQSA